MKDENKQHDGETIELTRGELSEIIGEAVSGALAEAEQRRKEESTVYSKTVKMWPEPKHPNPSLGEQIRERREEMGLTVGDLASMTKISAKNIEEYENGLFYHTPHIVKIKKALEMD